jgi:hypothetical protein
MNKKVLYNYYDIAYKTKGGRLMVAKRVKGKNDSDARRNLKREMRASKTFRNIVSVIKL